MLSSYNKVTYFITFSIIFMVITKTEHHMTNEPYGSKSWNYLGFLIISWKLFNIFRILFLYVSEWIEKSLHLHCSTFNSSISVKICSFEEFNSALLAKFEVQSANFSSASYLCFTKKLIPFEWTSGGCLWIFFSRTTIFQNISNRC